jgi:hypothetical protein
MSTHFRKFFILNTIATIVVLIIGTGLFTTRFSEYFHFFYIILLILAYAINLTVFFIITKDIGGADKSLLVVAKSFAIKFFSYLILAVVFLLLSKTPEIKITFAIILFSLYLIYTVLEISSLIRFFKTE